MAAFGGIFDPFNAHVQQMQQGQIYGQPGGLEALYKLLSQGGRTDPTLLNMDLAGVSRGTQSAQDANRAYGARSGLGASGVLGAMQAAQGVGGVAQRAGLRAADAEQQRKNRIMNLQLLRDLVIGPQMQRYAADQGIAMNQMGGDRLGALLGALGTGAGMYFANQQGYPDPFKDPRYKDRFISTEGNYPQP